jgi:hypothetical protein
MKKKSIRLGILGAAFLFSLVWCSGGEAPGAMVVEVFGYAIPNVEQSISELHRQAMRDALENAVVQARVELDVQVRLEGMRIEGRRVHSLSLGYVETSRVLDAGYVMLSTNSPAVYRVHMKVSVSPLPTESGLPPLPPAVALAIHSERGEAHGKSCRQTLAASLRECGIQVVDLGDDPSAFVVNVECMQPVGDALGEIRWKMERSLAEPLVVAQGDLWVPAEELVFAAELDKLGVRMAMDALRLWSEPAAIP